VKGVFSRLQNCLDNLTAIEAWHQTLGLNPRLQLNQPNAVLRRWQAWRLVPAPNLGYRAAASGTILAALLIPRGFAERIASRT
jgi:hypothetical protein